MRLKIRACTALMLFACLAGVAACGENEDQRAASKTVSRFYEALKTHDATGACGLISPASADVMARALGEAGKSCVAALRDVFRRVATSANPKLFDAVPSVVAATAHGDRATVVISRGYQRRRLGLTRVGGRWQITGSPDFR